jgi:aminobenzoyl-glutamate utilization protein B
LPNHSLAELCYRNLERARAPSFSTEAKAFAAQVLANLGAPPDDEPFDERLTDPRAGITKDFAGGTDDVNEFCWHAPTARIYVAHGLRTTAIPNWARAAFCRGVTAVPTVMTAAKAVAYSALDLMTNPAVLAAAQEEFRTRADAGGWLKPFIPSGTLPPLDAEFAPAFVRDHELSVLRDHDNGSEK